MRDRVEVAGYVTLYDPLVAISTWSGESLGNVCHGVIRASIWPESIWVFAKVYFPYRFQDHPQGILYNPVKQDWDTERSLFLTVWFWDVHPFHRQRFKGLGLSVHEMSSESKWRETTVSGC